MQENTSSKDHTQIVTTIMYKTSPKKNSQTVKLNCLIKKQLIHDWRFAIHGPGELVWVMASENDHHRTVASDVDSKTNKHVESGEALMAITNLTFFSILSRRRFVKRPVFPEWFPTNLLARLTQNSVWKAKLRKESTSSTLAQPAVKTASQKVPCHGPFHLTPPPK